MHVRTRIFKLDGRRVVLNEPLHGLVQATIIHHIGPMWFELTVGDMRTFLPRSAFKLPPLPNDKRCPLCLADDAPGFAYADEPNWS